MLSSCTKTNKASPVVVRKQQHQKKITNIGSKPETVDLDSMDIEDESLFIDENEMIQTQLPSCPSSNLPGHLKKLDADITHSKKMIQIYTNDLQNIDRSKV